MKFTDAEFVELHAIAFTKGFPGYRPAIVEYPDGDLAPEQASTYRYSHIADKYIEGDANYNWLYPVLGKCLTEALGVAAKMGVPSAYWPTMEDSTLRILEYEPAAVSPKHTDFCLFTLQMYRNLPSLFSTYTPTNPYAASMLGEAEHLHPGIHFGELLEHLMPPNEATPHSVEAHNIRTQYSAVFFAMPPLATALPSGQTVGEWVEGRKNETRTETER